MLVYVPLRRQGRSRPTRGPSHVPRTLPELPAGGNSIPLCLTMLSRLPLSPGQSDPLSLCTKAVMRRIIAAMKLRGTFWIAAAFLALIGTPSLSCFVPRQLLNTGENDCCRQMGGQCGSKTMPSSQSCCESPRQVSQPYISSASHSGPSSTGVVLAVISTSAAPVAPILNLTRTFVQFHSPPLRPPEAISVLRI